MLLEYNHQISLRQTNKNHSLLWSLVGLVVGVSGPHSCTAQYCGCRLRADKATNLLPILILASIVHFNILCDMFLLLRCCCCWLSRIHSLPACSPSVVVCAGTKCWTKHETDENRLCVPCSVFAHNFSSLSGSTGWEYSIGSDIESSEFTPWKIISSDSKLFDSAVIVRNVQRLLPSIYLNFIYHSFTSLKISTLVHW